MRALLTVAIFENFAVHYQLPLIYCNINSIIGTEGGPVISSAKNETILKQSKILSVSSQCERNLIFLKRNVDGFFWHDMIHYNIARGRSQTRWYTKSLKS